MKLGSLSFATLDARQGAAALRGQIDIRSSSA